MQLFKIVFWIYSIRYIVTLQIYIYILNKQIFSLIRYSFFSCNLKKNTKRACRSSSFYSENNIHQYFHAQTQRKPA